MWNEPTEKQLAALPPIYTNDDTPWRDVLIHQHYFLGSSDWFVAEYDSQSHIFYGYAILNADLDNSEWGSMSLDEMRAVSVRGIEIDRDLHWRVRVASHVEKIAEAYRHQGIE